jgi:hypothetical protein
MRKYYMQNVLYECYMTVRCTNKREARKIFKNQYGVYPEYIELEDRWYEVI